MKSRESYFTRHKNQRQVVFFLLFSFFALIAQLLSRIICDMAFQNLTLTVSLPPFPEQALGSLFAFLISNIIAKALSFILNRKNTFKASNNLAFSITIYVIMVVILIVVETAIGTPLQNGLYMLFGGTFDGAHTTSAANSPTLYQICGTISQLIYGIADAVIVFFMDKYVIMHNKKNAGDFPDESLDE